MPAHNPLLVAAAAAAAAHLGTMSDMFVIRQELPLSRLLKSSANACIQSAAQQQCVCSHVRLLHSHTYCRSGKPSKLTSACPVLADTRRKHGWSHELSSAALSAAEQAQVLKHVHTLLPTRGAP